MPSDVIRARIRALVNRFAASGQSEAILVAELMDGVLDDTEGDSELAGLVEAVADEFIAAANQFKLEARRR